MSMIKMVSSDYHLRNVSLPCATLHLITRYIRVVYHKGISSGSQVNINTSKQSITIEGSNYVL